METTSFSIDSLPTDKEPLHPEEQNIFTTVFQPELQNYSEQTNSINNKKGFFKTLLIASIITGIALIHAITPLSDLLKSLVKSNSIVAIVICLLYIFLSYLLVKNVIC
jgi:ABC-type spermidine/putrescine transport system permease subunit I